MSAQVSAAPSTSQRRLPPSVTRNLGLVIAEGRVVHVAKAADINEHQILDLIVEGTPA